MLFGPALDAGLVLLIAVALAEYFGWRDRAPRGFTWLAIAGIWLVFAGVFPAVGLEAYLTAEVWTGIQSVFLILGWIFALVGAVFTAYETLAAR